MGSRKDTRPGLGFPPTERPTDPSDLGQAARRRISWQADTDEEIRELDKIIKAWLRMSTEDRVIISALCRRFDPQE